MNEQQYINSTNRVKVSAALTILRDVLVCGECGIDGKEFATIKFNLRKIEEKLFRIVEITEGE
jgi:hypothetical protein